LRRRSYAPIQFFDDGKLVVEADDILTLPMVARYDAQGNRVESIFDLGQPQIIAHN